MACVGRDNITPLDKFGNKESNKQGLEECGVSFSVGMRENDENDKTNCLVRIVAKGEYTTEGFTSVFYPGKSE